MLDSPRISRALIALIFLPSLLFLGCGSEPQELSWTPPPAAEPIRLTALPLADVKVEDDFWSPRIETNRTKTLPHTLAQLEETGSVANFEIAAGMAKGEFSEPYWADSDVYKWLQGASYHLALQRDPELEAKVDNVIGKIAAAQRRDGYLNTHVQLVTPQKRWKNLGFYHEMYSAGHLFEGAAAHFEATGKRTFLDVATKLADNIDSVFGPGKRNGIPGHEEIELGLIDLYQVTGEERYLRLAEFFLNGRGQKPSVFELEYEQLSPTKTEGFLGRVVPVRGLHDRMYRRNPERFDTSYAQDHLPVREQTEAVGHAVRAMYLYSAMADVVYETGDQSLMDALLKLHDNVTLRRMYVTGGIGPSEHNEGFEKDYDLPNQSAYQETCATVGLALWNHRMLQLTGDGRYSDVAELALYNSFLGGVSLEGRTFCYANPMQADAGFKRSPWFSVPCCPSTIVRTFPRLGKYIYSQARAKNDLWVNFYIASTAKATIGGSEVLFRLSTEYPWNGDIRLEPELDGPVEFALHLRIPGWAESYSLRLDGQQIRATELNGYVHIEREWSPGDTIELSLPMKVERIEAHPNVVTNRGKVALRRGPIIYSLEEADNTADLDTVVLPADAQLTGRFEPDLFNGVYVITAIGLARDTDSWGDELYRPRGPGGGEEIEVRAVPYAFWGNRGVGKMIVWLDTVL